MKKLRYFTLGLSCLVGTSLSYAQESDLGKIYHLAEDVRDISWQVAPISDNYRLTKSEADRVVAYGELEGEIADYAFDVDGETSVNESTPCPDVVSSSDTEDRIDLQKRIRNRQFSIYFMGTFNSPDAVAQAEGTYGRNNYYSFMSSLAANGNSNAGPINTLTKLETKYLKTANAPGNWDSLSTIEQSKLLQSYAASQVDTDISLGLILSEYAIDGMLAHPDNWKEQLSGVKEHLSFAEKIRLASHFGGEFGDDYNYDRANDVGDEGEGIVSIEEMLKNLSNSDVGGICRDVALAQAQILKELGVSKDDIYMIGYQTVDGGHAVLAVKDPDNPDNIVKLNYGYITEEDDVKGGAALTQDTSLPDMGMQYRVYDSEGTPVARVPSEIGQILNEVTNGDYNKRDISKTYSLQKVGIETPYGGGSFFTGTTSAGDNVVGVAINKTLKSRFSETEIGIGAIERKGDRTLVAIDQQALYGRLKYTLNSPEINVGDNFSLNIKGGAELEGMYMDNTVTSHSSGKTIEGINYDYSTTLFGGVGSSWESEDGATKVNSEVIVSGYMDWKNEVNTSEGQTLALDHVRWTTGVQHEVTEEMKLLGEGSIVMYNVGPSAILKMGLIDDEDNWSVGGAYQKNLDDLPSFMPGASETLSAGVNKSWKDKMGRGPVMTLEYVQDLDYDSGYASVGIGWKF